MSNLSVDNLDIFYQNGEALICIDWPILLNSHLAMKVFVSCTTCGSLHNISVRLILLSLRHKWPLLSTPIMIFLFSPQLASGLQYSSCWEHKSTAIRVLMVATQDRNSTELLR